MIIATAGHVDHGKTALVKALTGVDTDTLAEEKRRGLSIDLGFAYLPLNGQHNIGFIDVPGHERFIKNALCGLASADYVLLVVAADDGPMPQTREHLAIIDLLGIQRGAIVVSKTDRVEEKQITALRQALAGLTENRPAADWPVLMFSCLNRQSIECLKAHLLDQTDSIIASTLPIERNNFRLAVDRVFGKKGIGVIVTGTIFSGSVGVGDPLVIGGSNRKLRVRGLHVQNSEARRAVAGQRCAINLTGRELGRQSIRRGDWLTAAGVPGPVHRFDAGLRLIADTRPMKHWTPVHLHHAASETTARVAVFENGVIKPGETGLVQIVCDKPVGAVFGDRFIVRDQSARKTLGGGRVIDIFPPKRGRAKPERIQFLKLSDHDNAEYALQKLMENFPQCVDIDGFVRNRNLATGFATELLSGFDKPQPGQQKKVAAACRPLIALEDEVGWTAIAKALDKEGVRGVLISELADTTRMSPNRLSSLLTGGVRSGLVVKLSEKLVIGPHSLKDLRDILKKLDKQGTGSGFGLSAFREATGLGRNRAIEMLESLDRQGVTRRNGQIREMLNTAERRFDQLLKQVE